MEARTIMPATHIQDEHDPLSLAEFDSLTTSANTPIFELLQTDSLHFLWSTPSPTAQRTSAEPVQSIVQKLITTPNLKNPQTIILPTNSSSTTQHLIIPLQSNSDTSLIPQSITAPSLTTRKSCTNSYTLPPTNPLLASFLSSFPSTL